MLTRSLTRSLISSLTRCWMGLSASGLLFGCATPAGSPAARQGTQAAFQSTGPTVAASVLSADGVDETVLDALGRYRPLFLHSRGAVPMVTIDGSPMMSLAILQTLTVSAICDVRLIRASSADGYVATTSTEGVTSGDVLYVRTRTGRRSCGHR